MSVCRHLSRQSAAEQSSSGRQMLRDGEEQQLEVQQTLKKPMKRFSSALCLAANEQKAAQQAGSSHPSQSEQLQVCSRSSSGSHQHNKSSKRTPQVIPASAAASAAKPDMSNQPELLDPMLIYARRRRPSASNQGSVNVDQQGECDESHFQPIMISFEHKTDHYSASQRSSRPSNATNLNESRLS